MTPRFIQFQVKPSAGTKVRKVQSLSEEIALELGTREARIYRSGKEINVEVPREEPEPVRLLPLCQRLAFVPPQTAVLGVEESGTPLLLRLSAPDVAHVLVAGTTGSGKTALARTLLTSLVMYNQPSEVQLLLIDPKGRGFGPLRKLPHVLATWCARTRRQRRGCAGWSANGAARPRAGQAAGADRSGGRAGRSAANGRQSRGRHVDAAAQRGREAGIHLVACTQKPTAGIIGGGMVANFPVRLVGSVASKDEARYATGLSESGAEKLEGKGDFLLVVKGECVRFQAAWLSPDGLETVLGKLNGGGSATASRPQQSLLPPARSSTHAATPQQRAPARSAPSRAPQRHPAPAKTRQNARQGGALSQLSRWVEW